MSKNITEGGSNGVPEGEIVAHVDENNVKAWYRSMYLLKILLGKCVKRPWKHRGLVYGFLYCFYSCPLQYNFPLSS